MFPLSYREGGIHYGDVVGWDMLLGTDDNPQEWARTCGFTPEREERLLVMLVYRDVHRKVEKAGDGEG